MTQVVMPNGLTVEAELYDESKGITLPNGGRVVPGVRPEFHKDHPIPAGYKYVGGDYKPAPHVHADPVLANFGGVGITNNSGDNWLGVYSTFTVPHSKHGQMLSGTEGTAGSTGIGNPGGSSWASNWKISYWIGIEQSSGSTPLIQAGVSHTVNSSDTVVSSLVWAGWVSASHNNLVYPSLTVNAGDSVEIEITYVDVGNGPQAYIYYANNTSSTYAAGTYSPDASVTSFAATQAYYVAENDAGFSSTTAWNKSLPSAAPGNSSGSACTFTSCQTKSANDGLQSSPFSTYSGTTHTYDYKETVPLAGSQQMVTGYVVGWDSCAAESLSWTE